LCYALCCVVYIIVYVLLRTREMKYVWQESRDAGFSSGH